MLAGPDNKAIRRRIVKSCDNMAELKLFAEQYLGVSIDKISPDSQDVILTAQYLISHVATHSGTLDEGKKRLEDAITQYESAKAPKVPSPPLNAQQRVLLDGIPLDTLQQYCKERIQREQMGATKTP